MIKASCELFKRGRETLKTSFVVLVRSEISKFNRNCVLWVAGYKRQKAVASRVFILDRSLLKTLFFKDLRVKKALFKPEIVLIVFCCVDEVRNLKI